MGHQSKAHLLMWETLFSHLKDTELRVWVSPEWKRTLPADHLQTLTLDFFQPLDLDWCMSFSWVLCNGLSLNGIPTAVFYGSELFGFTLKLKPLLSWLSSSPVHLAEPGNNQIHNKVENPRFFSVFW